MDSETVAESEERPEYVIEDIDLDNYSTIIIALTGPPASGKSTVVGMLRDMGVPCRDTGEAIRDRAAEEYDEPTEDEIWQVAQDLRDEHGPEAPTAITKDWIKRERAHGYKILCIASLREQAELDWLRKTIGPTLAVRIDADQTEREYRYVEQKLDGENETAVNATRIQSLRAELREREDRESPYPDHDVQIRNDNNVSVHDVYTKLDHLVETLHA